MYHSVLAAQVDHLARERDYYKQKAEEQQEIIEQLTGTGKPKGYVYMHPYDLGELINRPGALGVIDIYKFTTEKYNEVHYGGRVIRQSPFIPPVTKNIQ